MNPVQTVIEAANSTDHSLFSRVQSVGEFQNRIQSLIEAQRLKVVIVDGAGGCMLQSPNGPQLYVPSKLSSASEQQRVTWQLRAFLDAVEAAS